MGTGKMEPNSHWRLVSAERKGMVVLSLSTHAKKLFARC